jgi:flagellar biosynthesis anti-sigma factor FlgM
MKVSNSDNSMIPKIYQDQIGRATRSLARKMRHTSPPKNDTDTLEISETAKLLRAAQEQLRKSDPARSARIADLKQQIETNEYQTPVAELAKRLLSGGFITV